LDLNSFHYDLPQELIAQYPLERGASRLMIVNRESGRITHARFKDLSNYLKPGDCLVLNNTRVIRARLKGRKPTGGQVEVLLVKEITEARWECLLKSAKPSRPGSVILFDQGVTATVETKSAERFELCFNDPDRLPELGEIPLPPYITRSPVALDASTYQTVFAQHDGSVAAPTAGLHFAHAALDDMRALGVEIIFITLHVGPGTFQPVRTQRIEEHRMHPEEFNVSEVSAVALNSAMADGRRIVAVGTTSTRVLEHLMRKHGKIVPGKGSTDLFITPGFSFGIVQALFTNFHLPCSTLIMLTCAFGGHDLVMKAYREAVRERYRFFSYGDAMFII
jgi:S-adenosylmethionine:tRNA ribosyltransferase-isomerase